MEKNDFWVNMIYYSESVRVKMSVDEKVLLTEAATRNRQSVSRFVLEAIAEKIKNQKKNASIIT